MGMSGVIQGQAHVLAWWSAIWYGKDSRVHYLQFYKRAILGCVGLWVALACFVGGSNTFQQNSYFAWRSEGDRV